MSCLSIHHKVRCCQEGSGLLEGLSQLVSKLSHNSISMFVTVKQFIHACFSTSGAVGRGQDFEKAGSLRDKEMELKAQISKITNQAKESEQAEVESGDQAGPLVTEADIANIVAQWTGVYSIAYCAYIWDNGALGQLLLRPVNECVGAFCWER